MMRAVSLIASRASSKLGETMGYRPQLNRAGSGSGNALTTNPLSQFAATTSAQLSGVISDETGSGQLAFATSPTLVSPTINGAGTTSATSGIVVNNSSGSNHSLVVRDDGFVGFGLTTPTFTGDPASHILEIAKDVVISGSSALILNSIGPNYIFYNDAGSLSFYSSNASGSTATQRAHFANDGKVTFNNFVGIGGDPYSGNALDIVNAQASTGIAIKNTAPGGADFRWAVEATGSSHGHAGGIILYHADDASVPAAWDSTNEFTQYGNMSLPNIPTSDPHVVGRLWSNSGVVTRSAG